MAAEKSFYFNPHAQDSGVFLGPTESRLMELAWKHKNLTVKKAVFHLGDKNELAYTTIMTVLGNLTEKGLLKKQKEGRMFSYSPTTDKARFIKERVNLVQKCLKNNFGKK